ncbi:uncharacterized protein LOC129592858 [Paramacrobiotus metropolitanus]|uniref:uncharacterized protein LOC129592858 n=1 Tax=Paramacrobiotus metropolitanus TaxID=2943436 RepID=UPI002445F1A6|nr:uncharacterized protein LOC129592858 [Paramacrobiotus metropolitanus]
MVSSVHGIEHHMHVLSWKSTFYSLVWNFSVLQLVATLSSACLYIAEEASPTHSHLALGYAFAVWTLLYNIAGLIGCGWGYRRYTNGREELRNHRAPGFWVGKTYLACMVINMAAALGIILQAVLQKGQPDAMLLLGTVAYVFLIINGACIVVTVISLRKGHLPTALIIFFQRPRCNRADCMEFSFIKDYYDWTVSLAFGKLLLGFLLMPFVILNNLYELETLGETAAMGTVSAGWIVFYNVVGLFGLVKGTRPSVLLPPPTRRFATTRGWKFFCLYTAMMGISALLAVGMIIEEIVKMTEKKAWKASLNFTVLGSTVFSLEQSSLMLSLALGAFTSRAASEESSDAAVVITLPQYATARTSLLPPDATAVDQPPTYNEVAELPPSYAEVTVVPKGRRITKWVTAWFSRSSAEGKDQNSSV